MMQKLNKLESNLKNVATFNTPLHGSDENVYHHTMRYILHCSYCN